MSTQAWGIGPDGMWQESSQPPKRWESGRDAGKSRPFMALDFLVVTKGSEACPPLSTSLV